MWTWIKLAALEIPYPVNQEKQVRRGSRVIIMAFITVWSLCAAILYTEMALISILLVPMPKRFRRKLVLLVTGSKLAKKLHNTLVVVFFFIAFMFVQSTLESMEAGQVHADANKDDVMTSLNIRMRMFRAQRNLYVSGGALFLLLVLNRFYSFIIEMGTGMDVEMLQKQAVKNNDEFIKILEERDLFEKRAKKAEAQMIEVAKDKEALTSQAKNTEKAYLNIQEEMRKVNQEVERLKNKNDDKKSE